jgi:uncharacterized membrane protein YdbT with pleckstrin-like domain
MGYIENNLLQNERVVYRANIHWFIFVPGAIATIIALFLFSSSGGAAVFGGILLVIGIFLLLKAFIVKISTELAVTSKRVIAKTGFIRRDSIELNHNKVESFNCDQSIFGRIFGFGTIVVRGTGGGKTPIPSIDEPFEFRRQAMQTVDDSSQPASVAPAS